MKDYCDITFILDRSGSMSLIKQFTIDAFNNFLAQQKSTKGDAVFSLVSFSGACFEKNQFDYIQPLFNSIPLQHVEPLNSVSYYPHGDTALNDAIGYTIDRTGQRLSLLPEENRPNKVIIVILTDGVENASKKYSRSRIQEMIIHQDEKYNWAFIFLGANMDAVRVAQDYGINCSNALTFAATPDGIQSAMNTASTGANAYRLGGYKYGLVSGQQEAKYHEATPAPSCES